MTDPLIVSLARAVERSPFIERRRVNVDELVIARRHPGPVATLLLVRWLLDRGARAESGWERLLRDLGRNSGVTLTERRAQYLKAFELGLKRPEVARLFRVSEETVKTELGHIYDLLGVRTVTGAVAEAIRRGLI